MQDVKIYEVEHYKPFHFAADLNEAYLNVSLEKAVITSNAGYFACSQNQFDQLLNKQTLEPIEIEWLTKQSIVVGKHNSNFVYDHALNAALLKQLIQKEQHAMRYFLKIITAHLTCRESEGKKIMNQVNIRILIAKIVQTIKESEALSELEYLNNAEKIYVTKVIRTGCNHLSKLAGGRSFISHNVTEMLCTFEVLNKIYLN